MSREDLHDLTIESDDEHVNSQEVQEMIMKSVMLKDKLSFVFSVLHLIITTIVLSKFSSSWMTIWYLLTASILIPFRYYCYVSQHMQYFLIDFCCMWKTIFDKYIYIYISYSLNIILLWIFAYRFWKSIDSIVHLVLF